MKKPLPSRCLKPASSPQLTTDGRNTQAIARKVIGSMDRKASAVANPAPKRMPR